LGLCHTKTQRRIESAKGIMKGRIIKNELKNINNVIDKIVRFDKYGTTTNF
jgi:hypothetical protein